MKKTFLTALISVAALAPFAAQAQSYLGASVGNSKQKLTVDDLGSDSATDTGFKLTTGSQFNQNFGIEAGYVKHSTLHLDADTSRLSSKPQTLYIAGTGTYPLAQGFALIGKLGVAFNRTKFTLDSDSETLKKNGAMGGVGVTYTFTSGVSAVLEYERYGKLFDEDGVKLEASMVSLGVRYNF